MRVPYVVTSHHCGHGVVLTTGPGVCRQRDTRPATRKRRKGLAMDALVVSHEAALPLVTGVALLATVRTRRRVHRLLVLHQRILQIEAASAHGAHVTLLTGQHAVARRLRREALVARLANALRVRQRHPSPSRRRRGVRVRGGERCVVRRPTRTRGGGGLTRTWTRGDGAPRVEERRRCNRRRRRESESERGGARTRCCSGSVVSPSAFARHTPRRRTRRGH